MTSFLWRMTWFYMVLIRVRKMQIGVEASRDVQKHFVFRIRGVLRALKPMSCAAAIRCWRVQRAAVSDRDFKTLQQNLSFLWRWITVKHDGSKTRPYSELQAAFHSVKQDRLFKPLHQITPRQGEEINFVFPLNTVNQIVLKTSWIQELSHMRYFNVTATPA